MTENELKELKIAKKNIKSIINECCIDVDHGFRILADTPLKSFNSKKSDIQESIRNRILNLNKKIQAELTW